MTTTVIQHYIIWPQCLALWFHIKCKWTLHRIMGNGTLFYLNSFFLRAQWSSNAHLNPTTHEEMSPALDKQCWTSLKEEKRTSSLSWRKLALVNHPSVETSPWQPSLSWGVRAAQWTSSESISADAMTTHVHHLGSNAWAMVQFLKPLNVYKVIICTQTSSENTATLWNIPLQTQVLSQPRNVQNVNCDITITSNWN